MIVHVNGQPVRVEDGATVAALLDGLDVPASRRGIAVAVDAQVVPRTEWDEHAVPEGARVELVAAIQGGA
jgi:sulfur carrier protein